MYELKNEKRDRKYKGWVHTLCLIRRTRENTVSECICQKNQSSVSQILYSLDVELVVDDDGWWNVDFIVGGGGGGGGASMES